MAAVVVTTKTLYFIMVMRGTWTRVGNPYPSRESARVEAVRSVCLEGYADQGRAVCHRAARWQTNAGERQAPG